MISKEFVITVTAYDEDEWALDAPNVYRMITGAVGYSGTIWVDAVNAFNREDYALIRTAKIPAIKRIRELIDCSLLEAKMIVDAVEKRQVGMTAFGVKVYYDPSLAPNGFHVSKA
jgi:hypothetical protein